MLCAWKNVSSHSYKPILCTAQIYQRSTALKIRNCVSGLCTSSSSLMGTKEASLPKDVSLATVTELHNLSPTVKSLKLFIESNDFTFQVGQWVDFFIPNEPVFAGFSICSTPRVLQESRQIELAVKLSEYRPVKWIHNNCRRGSQVGLRVGGDFRYQPSSPPRDLLLVAGGVGINPLISMMRHCAEHDNCGRIVLLFSSRTAEELIFMSDIQSMVKLNPNISAKFYVTRESHKDDPDRFPGFCVNYQRIDSAVLRSVLQSSFDSLSDVDCYVCGPNKMIDAVDECLVNIGVQQDKIKYEKWW